MHFDSNDLELGSAEAGLAGSTGPGQGHWWLELSSELDIEVLSFIRTIDGSLNAMHDTAPREGSGYRIATFNPGSEVDQVSLLQLVNPSEEDALAVITGIDDQGRSPGTEVHLTVPAGEATTLSALELETGTAAFEGALGDGSGKWQLLVRSETGLIVASLLSNPTGHLTNLSTVLAQDEHPRPDLEVGTPSVSDTSPPAGGEFTLSVTVQNAGDAPSPATTLRYYLSLNATISTLDAEVGTDAVVTLSPSGSITETVALLVPSGAGTYYYGACVDIVVGESETTDNCSASLKVNIEEPTEHPDLEVATPSVSDTSPSAGDEFTMSVTVRNTGDGPSAATTLRYYRSVNATISTLDAEERTDGIAALPVSGSNEVLVTLIAPSSAGTYYYGACVDTVPTESETTDNCSASVRMDVEEPTEHPDLEVATPSLSDTSPSTGDEFTMSVTVRNSGDGGSAATTLRYYRSANATISTLDTEVGTDDIEVLPASGSSAELVTLTAPHDTGTYYYGACVDTVPGESETTDNCSGSVAVAVEAPAQQPDLEVGIPTVSDSSPETGGSFTLSATVRNAGAGESAATTLRYYRSTNATISTLDTEVGTDAVGALSASGTSAESNSLTAPSTAGTYYYGACVDAVTGESDTTDNCSGSVAVTVEEPTEHPDLEVGTPSVSDTSPSAGDEFTMSATVRNSGDGGSAATTLRYYRSTDSTITSSDAQVGTDAVGALAASGTSAESISLTAPSTAGTYYYGACVASVAGESSTANNCSASVRVDVEEPESQTSPDLVVGTPTVSDSSPETSASFTLSVTVRNAGDGASAATTLSYYRSTDTTISTSDTSVGTDAVGTLAASGTSAESISLTAPSTAGTYYYGACVASVAGESSTANNCSGSVTVTVEAPAQNPDLVVGTPTVSDSSPETSVSFTLSVTVRNAGDGASAATTLSYYRSTDTTISTSDTSVGTDAVGTLAASGTSAESISLTAPSTAGTYYYGACVASVAGESSTANNCSGSVTVTVEAPAQNPDLVVGTPTVSDSSPETSASFTLSATVRNAGDGASAATTLRYYRSTDSTITSSDTQVGTDAVGALAASGTSAESISLTAPSTAGTYYYGACVASVAGESSTANNCSGSVTVTVEAPAQNPDLVVGTPTVSDSSPETSASFTLSATVRNAGDGASAATTLRYYRSTDSTITSSDTQVGTDAVGALAASGTSAESISLTAPSTAGTYYYGACVASVAGESSTANNCSGSVTVTVEAPAQNPDLVVGTPTVSDSSPETSASFTLSATVRNAGDGASAATTLRYYRSTDSTITSSDAQVGTDAVGALAASGTSAESISLTAPSTAGTYYYGACVASVAGESSTANNCSGSVTVTVEAPAQNPDLVVGTPTVSDSSPETSASFTLSATVRNAGDGASAATTLRYYRSTDSTITSSDTQVGTDAVGALAASGTSAESISLTAPSTAGTYYYGACVASVAGESNTTNNCSASAQVTVSEPTVQTPPDLTVGSPSVTNSTPDTGDLFTVSATVRNDGVGASSATTLRYYRSTDATITIADIQVGTGAVGGLSPGASTNQRATVSAPSTAGTYYYGACVDAVTGESDTTNNCSGSVQVTVSTPPSGPDLKVYAFSVNISPFGTGPGELIQAGAGVENEGDESSSATTVRFYQSTDATITTADTHVGTDTVAALSAGATISALGADVTAPSTAGTYYYGACVDSVTGESDTTNNCSWSIPVTVSE